MWIFRLAIPLLIVLSLLYIGISIYSRRVRRGKLELLWEERGRDGDREAFVRAGLEDYDSSLRRRLILLVYVVPLAAIGAIIYVVNYM